MLKNKVVTDKRGTLVPIEFKDLSFKPKRIFYVTGVPKDTIRGNHAHYKTQQLLICLEGKIQVNLFDGKKYSTTVITENESIFVDKLIWDNQVFYDPKAVLLVLCSTEYDEKDYIFDIEEFKKITQ